MGAAIVDHALLHSAHHATERRANGDYETQVQSGVWNENVMRRKVGTTIYVYVFAQLIYFFVKVISTKVSIKAVFDQMYAIYKLLWT